MLILSGTVVSFDDPDIWNAVIYIDGNGRIEAIQAPGDSPPTGYNNAPKIVTDGFIYPGLVDLHNHLGYNLHGLWIPPRQQPYTKRDEWRQEPKYHVEVVAPEHILTSRASEEALKYVEAKALVGGVTTIQGLLSLNRPSEGCLIHHVELELLDDGQKAAYQSVERLRPEQFQNYRQHMIHGSAFIYHLAEGTATRLLDEF